MVARLYSSGIHLTKEVEENREASNYYKHMDPTGEIYLQTIALLAGDTPKKAKLPRTITGDRYKLHRDRAVQMLEDLGEFLSERLGVGLDVTGSLVPYDSIFAPMSIVLSAVRAGGNRSRNEKRIEKWFVGAALDQRYQEGVHNKQEADLKEMTAWMEGDDGATPTWLGILQLPRLINASPNGAIGRMLGCLANRERPRDPLTDRPVGFYANASRTTERHHIFPKKFCEDFIPDWKDDPNLALNVMFTESDTNKKWLKMNPADQIGATEQVQPDAGVRSQLMLKHQLDASTIKILARPTKSVSDFHEFLVARERHYFEKFKEWFPDAAPSTEEVVSPELN